MTSSDLPSLVAIDLGAESCRVSLLERRGATPHIELIHRFSNSPLTIGDGLHWDLNRILSGIEDGLLRCAERHLLPSRQSESMVGQSTMSG